MSERQYTELDRFLGGLQRQLSRLAGTSAPATRESPATDKAEGTLNPSERRHAAALMRVNHAGEVSAQALYHGQALTARGEQVRRSMRQAAEEEADHLAWCARRVSELGGRTSLLEPFWYGTSFAIGAAAGLAGDAASLGFVAETERQVVEHLESHLQQLPKGDAKSRAVLEQMRADEAEHGATAMAAGGAELPGLVRRGMRLVSRIMTRGAYWI